MWSCPIRLQSHVVVQSGVLLCVSDNQHSQWRGEALLLSPLHLRRGHREHPARLPGLSRHHPAHAPPTVRALVIGPGESATVTSLTNQETDWNILVSPQHKTTYS